MRVRAVAASSASSWLTPSRSRIAATIAALRDRQVIPHLWRQGRRLRDGYNALAAETGRDPQQPATLRIGIALYNVYLNEADEWSRRLQTEIGEWALEHGIWVITDEIYEHLTFGDHVFSSMPNARSN